MSKTMPSSTPRGKLALTVQVVSMGDFSKKVYGGGRKMKCAFCDNDAVARLNNKWLVCDDCIASVAETTAERGGLTVLRANGEPFAMIMSAENLKPKCNG